MTYKYFFNFSQDDAFQWGKHQREVANYLADFIVNVKPPTVLANASSGDVALLAREALAEISELAADVQRGDYVLHIQCEQTLAAAIAAFAPANTYIACSTYDDSGRFVKFREIRFSR